MEPFDERVYVPILLTKRGERRALEDLDAETAAAIRPLFVAHPVRWDYEKHQPAEELGEHISSLPSDLIRTWGEAPAFFDAGLLGDELVHGGDHALFWICDLAADIGLPLTPVVDLGRSDPYVEAAAAIASRHGVGTCLRMSMAQWPSSGSLPEIDDLLTRLSLDPSDVHLILDLGEDVTAAAGKAVLAELRSLPYVDQWPSVTVAGTAMLPVMPKGPAVHSVPRSDWRIYAALCGLGATLPRVPSFGDYAVNGTSSGPDIDAKLMSIAATLRYCSSSEWLVSKAGLYKAQGGLSLGGAAVPPAARALVQHPDYRGANHCIFEEWLEPVAAGGPGSSPETWRRHGTHHHITVVVEQIANLHGP